MIKFLEEKLTEDNMNSVCTSMAKNFIAPIESTIKQEIDW